MSVTASFPLTIKVGDSNFAKVSSILTLDSGSCAKQACQRLNDAFRHLGFVNMVMYSNPAACAFPPYCCIISNVFLKTLIHRSCTFMLFLLVLVHGQLKIKKKYLIFEWLFFFFFNNGHHLSAMAVTYVSCTKHIVNLMLTHRYFSNFQLMHSHC